MTTHHKAEILLRHLRETVTLGEAVLGTKWFVEKKYLSDPFKTSVFAEDGNDDPWTICHTVDPFGNGNEANAAFIAHSRTAAVAHAKAMLVAVEALTRLRDCADSEVVQHEASLSLETILNLPDYAALFNQPESK